jgi:excisionase family DNA binding protein
MDFMNGKQLSVKEAAAMLGVKRDSVRRAIRKKRLRAWKLDTGGKGRHETWVIPQSSLEEYVRRNSNF